MSSGEEAINALVRLGLILITRWPLMLNISFWRAVFISYLSRRIKTLQYLHNCSYCSCTCAGLSPTNYNYRSNSPDFGEERAVLQWLILLIDYFHGFSPQLDVFILDIFILGCSPAMHCCINTEKTRFYPKASVFYKFPVCLFSPSCLLSPTLLSRS